MPWPIRLKSRINSRFISVPWPSWTLMNIIGYRQPMQGFCGVLFVMRPNAVQMRQRRFLCGNLSAGGKMRIYSLIRRTVMSCSIPSWSMNWLFWNSMRNRCFFPSGKISRSTRRPNTLSSFWDIFLGRAVKMFHRIPYFESLSAAAALMSDNKTVYIWKWMWYDKERKSVG